MYVGAGKQAMLTIIAKTSTTETNKLLHEPQM